MKTSLLSTSAFLLCLLASVGCTEDKHSTNEYPSDNSGKNQRDTVQGSPTPENQKENEVDLKITQKIRQDVLVDDSLSSNAKNVKIVTINRVVTLRGPVASSQEVESIGNKAKLVAGVNRVENQLEVTNP